jgi:coenzyme PQQ synthesis protein D (PqqD)
MTSPPLTPTSRIQHSDRHVHCLLDGVVIIMAVDSGDYFELNEVGSRLWRDLEEPVSIRDLVDRMVAEYDVDRDGCESDVRAWVARLLELGFVRILDD